MLRVTADSNIYISALHFGGHPLRFLEQARRGAFLLFISAPLQAELRRVLCDKFLWGTTELSTALDLLDRLTTLVKPGMALNAVPSDPDDNRVLECAVESESQFVATGDGDLLRLRIYNGIQILKVAAFMERLTSLPALNPARRE